MAISAKLWDFFCPNEYCEDYGKKRQGNVVVYDRYGRDRRKLLKCKTCNSKFSERRSKFFFGLHTKESKIKEVMLHLLEGKSFREAAAAADVDKDTVQRIWKKFVSSCEGSMEALLKEFNIRLEDLILLLYTRSVKNKV